MNLIVASLIYAWLTIVSVLRQPSKQQAAASNSKQADVKAAKQAASKLQAA